MVPLLAGASCIPSAAANAHLQQNGACMDSKFSFIFSPDMFVCAFVLREARKESFHPSATEQSREKLVIMGDILVFFYYSGQNYPTGTNMSTKLGKALTKKHSPKQTSTVK